MKKTIGEEKIIADKLDRGQRLSRRELNKLVLSTARMLEKIEADNQNLDRRRKF